MKTLSNAVLNCSPRQATTHGARTCDKCSSLTQLGMGNRQKVDGGTRWRSYPSRVRSRHANTPDLNF